MPSVIRSMLEDEKKRNLRMQNTYESELLLLPKGSIITRKFGNKNYYYLHYRVGNRVKSEYLGNDNSEVAKVKEAIAERKHLQGVIKRLKIEYKEICKIVKE